MLMPMMMLIVGADCEFPGFPGISKWKAKVKPGIIYLQFAFAFTFAFAFAFRHRTSIGAEPGRSGSTRKPPEGANTTGRGAKLVRCATIFDRRATIILG